DDEVATTLPPRAARPVPGPKTRVGRRARGRQRRLETDREPGDHRETEAEGKPGEIEPALPEARNVSRPERDEEPNGDRGHPQAGDAPSQREQQRPREELARDGEATGAERCPDRDLRPPMAGPDEHQMSDVGARNEEDERHGAEQEEKRP